MVGLVDGNNFFVSCERVFDFSLEGKPVAVLSNNDGCVISRSNEFKALQIPMGTPYFQLRDRKGLIFKSSNYELYGDLSRRVIATLHHFSPQVEQYSVDEAFIHLPHQEGLDFFAAGQKIRSTILKWVGIPCGVGFAATKTLAKIANHIGKKQPSGIFVMPDNPLPVLDRIPVGEVWGIGRRLAPKLLSMGIVTARNLAERNPEDLHRRFGVTVAKTVQELRGIPMLDMEEVEPPPQSITCSKSFGRPVTDFDELAESVAHFLAQASVRLRSHRQRAAGVNVYFQYYPEYGASAQNGGFSGTTVALEHPSNSGIAIMKAVRPKLRGIFIEGRRYKKSGVVFFGLESDRNRQLDLFADQESDERMDRLNSAMDMINRRFGKDTVFSLAEGIERAWSMRRDLLTPCYTTRWNELPVVK